MRLTRRGRKKFEQSSGIIKITSQKMTGVMLWALATGPIISFAEPKAELSRAYKMPLSTWDGEIFNSKEKTLETLTRQNIADDSVQVETAAHGMDVLTNSLETIQKLWLFRASLSDGTGERYGVIKIREKSCVLRIDFAKKDLISRYLLGEIPVIGGSIDPIACVKDSELKPLPIDGLLQQLSDTTENPDLPNHFYPIVATLWKMGYFTYKTDYDNRFAARQAGAYPKHPKK